MTRSSLMTRRKAMMLGAAGLALPSVLRAASALWTLEGRAFGTGWRVLLGHAPAPDLPAQLEALLAGIDRQMSPWRADSEIARFNAMGAGQMPVSEETARVTAVALDLARASGGHFDPSVGPLVARWGFGPIRGAALGWQALGTRGAALFKVQEGATLDLCGIAKGWALDRMIATLRRAGHFSALVDLGGEVRSLGAHPDGRAWEVGIEDPRGGLYARLPLTGAVATSGRSQQGYELGGRRYSHVIDPRARAPVAGDLEQVSVLAPDAMTADGWATALLAAGPQAEALAQRLVRTQGGAAVLLYRTAGGQGLRAQHIGEIPGLSVGEG